MNTLKMLLPKPLLVVIFSLITFNSFAQTFEGWILYKAEALNPNSALIPDSAWQQILQEQFGERGYMIQKYYYKGDKYFSEIGGGNEQGFQTYNTKDKLLYSWQADSDTAVTVDTKKSMDEIIEIVEQEDTETILGIPCKSMIIKTRSGKVTIWYNEQYLKMDAALFKGHQYGHWEEILKRTGCLPLKMEQTGFMTHVVQTAIDFKEESIEDKRFLIPSFKVYIGNSID